MSERISRRDFLRSAAIGLGAVALESRLPGSSEEEVVLDVVPKRVANRAVWPIDGNLSEIMGDGKNPGLGYTHLMPTVNADYTFDSGHHIGVDFNKGDNDDDCGEPLRMIMDGVCVHASKASNRDLGNIAIFCHKLENGNLVYSRYAHLLSYAVEPGKEYSRGQIIASTGKSGWEQGHCHLHLDIATRLTFDWHYTGIWQDPRWYPHKASVQTIKRHFLDPAKIIRQLIQQEMEERFERKMNLGIREIIK